MAKFSTPFAKNPTSTTVGVMSLEAPAASPRRNKVYELDFGSDAPALGNSAWRFDLQRSTGPASGTTVAPGALDPADVTLSSLVKNNLTANGTLGTVVLLSIPVMQQATFRWVAREGSELITPAANTNGLHLLTPVTGNTLQVAGTIFAEEQ